MNFARLLTSFAWFQNGIDLAVSLEVFYHIPDDISKNYVVCRNTAKVVKLKCECIATYKCVKVLT